MAATCSSTKHDWQPALLVTSPNMLQYAVTGQTSHIAAPHKGAGKHALQQQLSEFAWLGLMFMPVHSSSWCVGHFAGAGMTSSGLLGKMTRHSHPTHEVHPSRVHRNRKSPCEYSNHQCLQQKSRSNVLSR
jgi:hypothetical protein